MKKLTKNQMYMIAGGAALYLYLGSKAPGQEEPETTQTQRSTLDPRNPDNVVRSTLGIDRGGKVDQFFYRIFDIIPGL